MPEDDKTKFIESAPPILAKIKKGERWEKERFFTENFVIGRQSECGLQVHDFRVSRIHARVFFDGDSWWIKDMGSANGTYLNGTRIQEMLLPANSEAELGRGGPVISLVWEGKGRAKSEIKKEEGASSVTQIMDHYFGKSSGDKMGERTLMFRKAFERAHQKRSRKYWVVIGLAIFLLAAAGGGYSLSEGQAAEITGNGGRNFLQHEIAGTAGRPNGGDSPQESRPPTGPKPSGQEGAAENDGEGIRPFRERVGGVSKGERGKPDHPEDGPSFWRVRCEYSRRFRKGGLELSRQMEENRPAPEGHPTGGSGGVRFQDHKNDD
ncbi:MAG: hypothetical protein H6Q42_4741 [Deltaproteobacteria bacterium]|nr:hypothetical protein [Deltaproteobacteria bacterium]